MRSIRLALVAALPCALGCGDGSPAPLPFHVAEGDNVLSLSVNGVHCAKGSYLNKPCVSVTVCAPGTADCQTIDDVLLDTGSFGLRVFKQVLTVSLPNVSSSGGGSLAECVHFADGTADWGPVATADVVLAKEPAVRVPIQVIDATFGAVPPSCPDPETEPTVLNGILGVGVFVEDCGVACAADPRNGTYYSSNGSTTSGAVAAVTSQVQNPVALLPVDNNGIIVALPAVDAAGAPAVEGAVVLGIGTRANNRPGPAATLALDGSGDFTTTVSGGAALPGSFVDTGSNGLFFAPPSPIPACTDHPEWFCPPAVVSLSATSTPSHGEPGASAQVSFQIANFDALVVQPNDGDAVFAQVGGGALPKAGFDWGLPFFLGRTVYLGVEGRRSTLGTGPFVAY